MRHLRYALIFLLLACAAMPQSFAADASVAHYVTTADLPPQLLPPPPAEGSPAWRANVRGVLVAQHKVSADDLMAMRDEQHVRLEMMVDAMGRDFTRENYPHTFAFLDNVLADTEAISGADKQFWHTRRPYLADPHVKLMIDRIDQSPAYPSGHTSSSRVVAEVLGMIYPDHRDALRARADAIAYHRIEAGVHYPCDIEGGRMVAMMIVGALRKSPDFQADLAAAEQERHLFNK